MAKNLSGKWTTERQDLYMIYKGTQIFVGTVKRLPGKRSYLSIILNFRLYSERPCACSAGRAWFAPPVEHGSKVLAIQYVENVAAKWLKARGAAKARCACALGVPSNR